MIVSDKNVSDALTYLADDPHPIALARKDLTDAENEFERVRAAVYLEQTGTVGEREAGCELDSRVGGAKAAITEAAFALDRHRARMRAAEMLIEVWRSENANVRAAERVR
jgi:hypothetical protein